MNSSQVLIAKRILQTLIKNIHLEDPEKKIQKEKRCLYDLCGKIFSKNWLIVLHDY